MSSLACRPRWPHAAAALFTALATLIALTLAAWPMPSRAAANYPDRPIRLVVPYPAGGSADILARLFAQQVGPALGQPLVVENRPGAGTAIGAKHVARAEPDGYTLLLGTVSSQAMNPALTDVGYDPVNDFTPIASLVSVPFVILVNDKVPARTLPQLIALAKQKPGQLNYASAGNGTSNHLAGVLLNQSAGIALAHVPYKGSGPAMTDLLSGQVDAMFDLQLTAMPQLKTGRVRALAITSTSRSKLLPDLPTVAETGVPGFEVSAWFGLFGPAGMAPPIVARLNAAFNEALHRPEVRARLLELGTEASPGTPADFARYVQRERVKWQGVVGGVNAGR